MEGLIHAFRNQFLDDMVVVIDRVFRGMPSGIGRNEIVLADQELHIVLVTPVLKVVTAVQFAFSLFPMILRWLDPSIDLGQFSRAPTNIFHRWGPQAARMLKNLRVIRSRRFHACIVETSKPESKPEFCLR